MATDNIRLCVARGVVNRQTGQPVTGVFAWTGRTWLTATIAGLVKELPASISDADLRAEYSTAVRAQREGAR
jgi:hypothetical protein